MLIDTGGLKNYDIATKKIIPYLHYLGYRRIDIVVITHNDFDHYGALESLNHNIIVKKIVDDSFMKHIEIGTLSFDNLNIFADDYDNENDKSIVLYGNICNLDMIFMGDASMAVEKNIINLLIFFLIRIFAAVYILKTPI